jgi:glycine dehydrogenase
VEAGGVSAADSVLHGAPHTAQMCSSNEWHHAYDRERAAYPAAWLRESKYWPPVARVDNVYGDRHLVCTCPPIEAYAEPVL